MKGIVNLEVNLYKGLKYNGLYSYASSHHSAIDWATEESAYVATIRGYNFGEGTEEDIESTSFRTEVYIMKRITSNALL